MFYSICHLSQFRYSTPVSESLMEVRQQPRSEGAQRCLSFELTTRPRAPIMAYYDGLGNLIHHFGIPSYHSQLEVKAESVVEIEDAPDVPEVLPPSAWEMLDAMVRDGDYWEMLLPSRFVQQTELLCALADELGARRTDDPLTVVRRINRGIREGFAYVKQSTRVDSPIDDALSNRRGVCQDFTHIMIALARNLGIPCRYVSGYLYHVAGESGSSAGGATHAWAEALLPGHGWVGFDPTNDTIVGERHIRVAIGRDYADVPPTRGVFKKEKSVESELSVTVRVDPMEEGAASRLSPASTLTTTLTNPLWLPDDSGQQMQQQQ